MTFGKKNTFLLLFGLTGLLFVSYLLLQLYNLNYALTAKLSLAPVAILGVYVMIRNERIFYESIFFLLPLSVGFKDVGGGIGISIPSEPLMVILAFVGFSGLLLKGKLNFKLMAHPISLIIGLQVLWIIITALHSTDSIVSGKFLIVRCLYLLIFYLFLANISQSPDKIRKLLFAFVAGFVPVIIFSLIKLYSMGLSREFSPVMAEPFFDDHTVFGAVISLVLPFFVLMSIYPQYFGIDTRKQKLTTLLVTTLMFAGVFFSFSRASWLSLVVTSGLGILLWLGFRFRHLVMSVLILGTLLFVFKTQVVNYLQKNKTDSVGRVTNIAQSITNVSTDESNLERLNRWASAIRMYREKPLWGFGPGTFESNYAGYQSFFQKTRISTDSGDRGDAHSEYFGSMAEQGLPGLIIFLILILITIHTGIKVYRRAENRTIRLTALGLLLGLFTYYIHAGVNSFLDIDKAASLFWAMTCFLALLDVNNQQKKIHNYSLNSIGKPPGSI